MRNKRGGGKLTAYQREEGDNMPVIEDGERVESLIRRIMKRAEKEEAERKKLTDVENEKRRKAKQEALGMIPSGEEEEDKIKVKDMSLDLELRSRPWNSRSHADRSEILYQTLFRPFTKNI